MVTARTRTRSNSDRRAVVSTSGGDAPPPSSNSKHRPQFPARNQLSSTIVSMVTSEDIDNDNKKSCPPPPRKNSPLESHTHSISTSSTVESTCSYSNPPKYSSSPIICVTTVPSNVRSSTSMSSNLISIPPPPPRRKSKPFKYSPPPPRSKINDRHNLLVEKLANSNMAPPIPIWKPDGNAPNNVDVAQLYPPPPRRPRQVDGTHAALARVYPKVKNTTTKLRKSNEENSSDQSRNKNKSSITTPNDEMNVLVVDITSVHQYKHQELSLSSKTGKQPSNIQVVTPLPNLSSGSYPSNPIQEKKQSIDFSRHRPDYTLGETTRSPSHMIAELTLKRATEAANLLSTRDYAFVKRSNGCFSYASLAFRSNIQEGGHSSNNQSEECMTFVVSKTGHTKAIKKSQWGEYIRLVFEDNVCKEGSTSTSTSDVNVHTCKEGSAEVYSANNCMTIQQNDVGPDKSNYDRGSIKCTTTQQNDAGPDESNYDRGSIKCTTTQENDAGPDESNYDRGSIKILQEMEDFLNLNTLRTELLLTRGMRLPSTVSFDGNEDDDLISCVSLPRGLSTGNPKTVVYTPSQPKILE